MNREEAIKWIDALSIYLSICDNQSLKDSLSSDIEKTIKALDMAIEALTFAQEIIQCKDCNFWTHIKGTKRYWCRKDEGLYDSLSPNDFCSRAERRTDE